MSDRPRWREQRPGETLKPGTPSILDGIGRRLVPDDDDLLEEEDEPDASSALDIALAIAASGLPVFPCNALKRPAIAGGHGYQDASTDPDRIRELWCLAGSSAVLVGVPTGDASGFDVLDFDPRNGSDAWRAANIHRLPETRVHGTPGLPKVPADPTMPGEHWLFRHVDGVRNIQDGQSIAPGIDVRGSGGYVIMPPSASYTVIHETDVAPWPDWLLPLVLKVAKPAFVPAPSSYATPAKVTDARLRGFIDREVRRVRDAPLGGRHHARFAAARSIGGVAAEAGLSDTEAEEMLIAARPPEVEEEKERRTIRDGLASGRAAPIDLNTLPDSALFRGQRQHRGNGVAPEGDGEIPQAQVPDDPAPELETEDPRPEPPPHSGTGAGPDGETAEADSAAVDILRAIDRLGPDLTRATLVALFNKRYAMANEGGKALVMWVAFDPVLARDRIDRASFDDFKKFYCNRKLTVSIAGPDGKPKNVTKNFAEWWLEAPQRRQYLGGVVFAPGAGPIPHTLNLWRGWAVKPTHGDWSLMSKHIHEVICAGRTDVSGYVIKWLAYMIQHPSEAGEVAIVVRGLKGVGKTIFGKWLLRLCGQHGLHIHNPVHLTGRFTGHLRDVIFVLADEAFFAGDKEHERILKGIITDDQLLIEAKYRTAALAANMLHLMMFSNEDWVIPATHDERRYVMMQADAAHRGDFAYFAALDAQMENGGLAAMLHEFATMDLGDFHPRRSVPDTPELSEQKLHSLASHHRWWMAVLSRGFVWRSRYGHSEFLRWEEFATTELLNRSYAQWCQENRIAYPAPRIVVGRMLAAAYKAARPRLERPVYEADSVDPHDPKPVVKLGNQHGYKVGTLAGARALFRDALGLEANTSEWDAPVEEDDG